MAKIKPEFIEIDRESMWDWYSLVIKLPKIAGGIPSDPKLVEAWQRAKWPKGSDEQIAGAVTQTLAELGTEAPGWNTFKRDREGHFCLEARQVKAMLKEAAEVTRAMLLAQQKDAVPFFLRARLAEKVHVEGDLLPFIPWKTEPDESPEKPIHVMTARGPRDALKKVDVLWDVEVHCRLKVLADGEFTEPLLKTLLNFACDNGLGADRSQGMGTFDYGLRRVQ